MSRCAICKKRNWFWQFCLPSEYGFGHARCIHARFEVELQIKFMGALAFEVLQSIRKNKIITRAQIPPYRTKKEIVQ